MKSTEEAQRQDQHVHQEEELKEYHVLDIASKYEIIH